MITLLATDLDGTLLSSDRQISARTAAAMAAASEAGIEVVWATARARHSVQQFAMESGFRGTALCANGAVVVDLADGTPVVKKTVGIDVPVVRSVIDSVSAAAPGVAFAAVGAYSFAAQEQYAALSVFVDHHRDPATMQRFDDYPTSDEPIVKVVARHPDIEPAELFSRISGLSGVELTHSGAPYIEMSAAGVSKGTALAALCAQSGIDASSVAAVGDALNDMSMLAWAGTALCPADAHAEVTELADRILPSNDEDGVAQYLEELIRRR